ncbi:hypothetical protein CR194_12275 [Salipaludibacillus keqinensis]|uniref:Lipoprotein n=1 Tax=Salipaludibacillus keqinensis TaxID=2045207 RepID=A0A323TIV6_9BACI|nr:DUF6612 family protein [Salipaludibacillus keqinensis]PYZ93904.1 hypothetical protein CR194_12275 [Salipaludibacillus keqinensis]
MKKGLLTLVSAGTLVALTACGDMTSDDGMSVEEILNESISAMESLESYSMTMDMQQVMNVGDEEGMSINSSSTTSLFLDPIAMKQTTEMNMGDMGLGEEAVMEYLTYFTEEDGFFVEDPTTGDWIKLPESFMDEILAMSDAQMSPEDQLKPFKEYISDLSIETTDDSYLITLTGEGIDMDEFMAEMNGMGMENMDPMMSEMMGDIDVEALNYEITIDKESFYQTESTIEMTMNMDMMGESMTTEQTVDMVLTDFNEVDPIEVPQDVLDNAKEMSEEEMMGAGQ